ncbi:ATP-NAD kinase family protein [Solirubrobacter soli]|uniref:ATP-NAD kinase family protein n=1 Tax=Solirubrobacter soli TaxID=363832 RepID=UPI0004288C86|nr:NAD(+)/NADH kinase [Solirubrobacter soli]
MPTLGLVVNPIAGMGGRVALRGTDGPEALRLARERGAVPLAGERARRALARLPLEIRLVAAPGAMGADVAAAAGLRCETTGTTCAVDTTAADTWAAAAEMRARRVDLLLFAGGDGTARDIHDAIGVEVPLVGIPTGVKMHSGVFAATPDAAGRAAAAYLLRPGELQQADIADVDEEAARDDRVATRLYGEARVPRAPQILAAKAPSPAGDGGLQALCEALRWLPGVTLLGPGTTTARIRRGTLLGVDALLDGELIATDLDEQRLLEIDADRLILGVVGGQGSLLGRGNQQLSPRVLRRIPELTIVASADKLARLDCLRVDTGDDELDAKLCGYTRVHTAPGRTTVMKVST